MKNYWKHERKELESFKFEIGGRSTDISQIGYSLSNYIQNIFPINCCPINIENQLNLLLGHLNSAEECYDKTLEFIINELQTGEDKFIDEQNKLDEAKLEKESRFPPEVVGKMLKDSQLEVDKYEFDKYVTHAKLKFYELIKNKEHEFAHKGDLIGAVNEVLNIMSDIVNSFYKYLHTEKSDLK